MNITESTRAYLYRVALAIVILATAYGVIAGEEQVAAITGVVTALLGNGLATLNTSTDRN